MEKLELVAYWDHESKVRVNPLELDLSKFDCQYCDICHTNHYRKITYIVRDENGKLLQVGRNCFKKAMGYEPTCYNGSEEQLEESLHWGYRANDKYYDTKEFLYSLVHYCKLYGFNKNVVFEELVSDRAFRKYLETLGKRDYTEIETIIDWYRDLEPKNNFMENLRQLVINDTLDIRYFNVIKYAYKIYIETINYKPEYNSVLVDYTTTRIVDIQLMDTRNYTFGYNNTSEASVYRIIDDRDNVFQFTTTKKIDFKAGDLISYKLKMFKYVNERDCYTSKKYGVVNKISYVKKI